MDKKKVPRQVDRKIPAFHTLLIQQYIQICQKIKISLTLGSAQIFGMQLKKNYPHYYSIPCSLPVYTWEGAQIKIEWTQFENTKNSSSNWIDITEKNNLTQSTPMLKYLQLHQNFFTLRKVALQQLKIGPRIAIIGSEQSASQNICKLLLNYSGKFSMNPIFVDLDPQNSIFIDGSLCALEFEYKIIEDLYDRPNKLCFYYGNRSVKGQGYLKQVKFLADCVFKKLNKQIKDYKLHGTKQQHPVFASGIIIHLPRYKPSLQKAAHIQKLLQIISVFSCTHVLNIAFPELQPQISQKFQNTQIQSIKCPILQGSESFLSLPRPQKSKIQRYFNGESIKIRCAIDQIRIYQFMTGQLACRIVNIREQAVSKNVVAVLHAVLEEEQKTNMNKVYQKGSVTPIACLARISQIYQNQVVLEVGQQHFFEEFKNHIWVTSVTDQ